MMIDHTGVNVADLKARKRFYAAALAPLGYKLLLEFHGSVAGFGERGKPDFWVARGEPNTPRVHVAFRADTRQKVAAFYVVSTRNPFLKHRGRRTFLAPSSLLG